MVSPPRSGRKTALPEPVLFTLAALPFPGIDPVIVRIGPLAIHWYGVAYIVGILFGWWYAKRLVADPRLWGPAGPSMKPEDIDDFLVWAAIGIVVGGRVGYVLFYDFARYLANPLDIVAVWQGGMSFHGGFAGTTVAMILFARRHGIPLWSLFDIVSAVVPIGLFFGRLANFVNGELWGRLSDAPWAVVFPEAGPFARHPSQLYEAGLEGIVLLAVLALAIYRFGALKRPGLVTGLFVAGYALSRIAVEFFREPDPQLGYLAGGWLTMGMLLSLPMLAAGLWAVMRARRAGA
jgi:phosphatidylglycerol:prolipoprotein diacylglycerol transferase